MNKPNRIRTVFSQSQSCRAIYGCEYQSMARNGPQWFESQLSTSDEQALDALEQSRRLFSQVTKQNP